MSLFLTWLAFLAVQIAASVSPGPAFVLTVRNALTHGRKAGIATAAGLQLAAGTHALLVLAGITALMAKSILLFTALKYAGAAYLIYIGIKGIKAKRYAEKDTPDTMAPRTYVSPLRVFKTGYVTNLLNPKAIIFFTAIFTQFVHPQTPVFMIVIFVLTTMIIDMSWYSLVTLMLTNIHIKQHFMAFSHWIERVCGGLMIALGVRLALSKL